MEQIKSKQITNRLYSLDILKFIASIAVVLIHVESNFRPYEFVPNTELWDASIAVNLLTKWSVPVFIMCSGYFLLNDSRCNSYKTFITKRLSKVLIPFLVVSFIFTIHYQNMGGGVDLKWAMVGLIKNILGYPASAHLWFLYPLIGLYILTPLFKGILDNLNKSLILAMVVFCILVKTIIPFTDIIAQWQSNYWRDIPLAANAFAMYFLLGGYIGRTEFKKSSKIMIYILNVIVLMISFVMMYKVDFLYNRSLEVLIDISSINNLLMSLSLLILFKDIKLVKVKDSKLISNFIKVLSEINFGVFLLHPLFIDILKPMFNYNGDILKCMMNQLAIVYICTAILVFVLKRIPILKRIV